MTCTTCGRENPPQLTFCQECGQRLGPRIAPPTPPIGLTGGDPRGGEAPAPAPVPYGGTVGMPQRVEGRVEPRIDPRHGTALGGVAAFPAPPMPIASTPAAAGEPKRCRICETVNLPNVRYCTSCGSTLDPPAPQPPAPSSVFQAPIAAAPVPSPSPIAAPAPIAPARVVDLGSTIADQPRICGRCRGVVDPGAAFCKFCGAPLGDAAPVAGTNMGPPAHSGSAHPLAASLIDERPPAPRISAPPPVLPIASSPAPPPVLPSTPPPLPPEAPPVRAAVEAAKRPTAPMQMQPASSLSPPTPHNPMSPQSLSAAFSAGPRAAAPHHGKLVVIAKSGADGPSYPIGDTLDIGRVEGQIVVAEDPYLAPRHARLTMNSGKLMLRDLGGPNGVYLRLSAHRDMKSPRKPDPAAPGEVSVALVDGDFILVGQQVMKFEVVKDPEGGVGPASEHGTLLFGSPAAPRYARLGQRTVEGVTRDVYYVRKMETVLGRESGDVVFTEDPFLSRRHAAVRVLGPGGSPLAAGAKPPAADVRFALVDLGSSNGTFIKLRNEIDLKSGDHFRVGQQLFRVDLTAGN